VLWLKQEKLSCNFRQNQEPNCTPFYQKLERQCKFKSSYVIIGRICIKLKPKDIIRFLIGQFDLIMGQIKV